MGVALASSLGLSVMQVPSGCLGVWCGVTRHMWCAGGRVGPAEADVEPMLTRSRAGSGVTSARAAEARKAGATERSGFARCRAARCSAPQAGVRTHTGAQCALDPGRQAASLLSAMSATKGSILEAHNLRELHFRKRQNRLDLLVKTHVKGRFVLLLLLMLGESTHTVRGAGGGGEGIPSRLRTGCRAQ